MTQVYVPVWFGAYANIRTDCYVLLASLLCRPPSEDLLQIVRNLHWDETIPEKLDRAFKALRQAGHDYHQAATEEEFNRLFIGLGRGELVPYASWYRGKKIQSLPLASLRTDLMQLGIVRQSDSHESEDHAGVLCEIMTLFDREEDAGPSRQARFFRQHCTPWMISFFQDLQAATNAGFYRMVGLFGNCFFECEDEYLLSYDNSQHPANKGGSSNEERSNRQPEDISEECSLL